MEASGMGMQGMMGGDAPVDTLTALLGPDGTEGSMSPGLQGSGAAPGGASSLELEVFVSTHQLNNEAQGVLLSLSPDVQATVVKQFSPKTAQPGSYEMNGKFIMFARSVQRGSKGKGKGFGKDAWGDNWGMGGGWGGDDWGKGWGKGDWGKGAWGADPWGGKGDGWGGKGGWKGGDAWGGKGGWCGGDQWGKGGKGDAWGKGGDSWGGKGDAWGGKGGAGWGGKGPADGGMGMMSLGGGEATGPPVDPSEFVAKWGMNQDAQSVLFSLPPDVQQSVMNQFKGGEAGAVNGRFIVFARSVERAKKGFGKGKDGGIRWAPY